MSKKDDQPPLFVGETFNPNQEMEEVHEEPPSHEELEKEGQQQLDLSA